MRYLLNLFNPNRCFSFMGSRSGLNGFKNSCLGRRLTWSIWVKGSQNSDNWGSNICNVRGP